MPELLLPQNLEAEQGVLGSMLISATALDAGVAMLRVEDFYRPAHRIIFKALTRMADRGEPVDPITLREELRKMEQLEDCGGLEYLTALVESVPTAANLEYYAKIVQEKSILRQQQMIGHELPTRVAKAERPEEVQNWLLSKVDSLNQNRGVGPELVGSLLGPHYEWLTKNAQRTGLEGYTTGFSHLDCVTGGYGQPMFVLFKGRRKQGKTQHLVQTSINCLMSGKAAVIFSLDTPKHLMLNRYLGHLSGVNSFRVSRPSDDEWEYVAQASAWLWNQPLYFYYDSGINIKQIASYVRAIARSGVDIGLVAIDYAECLGSSWKTESREQELNQVAIGCQNLRNELGTTILLLSQVNKQGGERYSEALGNLADLILKWEIDKQNGIGTLVTEGNRLGGDAGFECAYDFGTSRIRELELDESDPTYPASWPWWYGHKRIGDFM